MSDHEHIEGQAIISDDSDYSFDVALDQLSELLKAEKSADHPDFTARKAELMERLELHRLSRIKADQVLAEAEEMSQVAPRTQADTKRQTLRRSDHVDSKSPDFEEEKRSLVDGLCADGLSIGMLMKTLRRLMTEAKHQLTPVDWQQTLDQLNIKKSEIREGFIDLIVQLNIPDLKSPVDLPNFYAELSAKPVPQLKIAFREAEEVVQAMIESKEILENAIKKTGK